MVYFVWVRGAVGGFFGRSEIEVRAAQKALGGSPPPLTCRASICQAKQGRNVGADQGHGACEAWSELVVG